MHGHDGTIHQSSQATHNNKTDAVARAFGAGDPCEAKAGQASMVCLTEVKSKHGGDQVIRRRVLQSAPLGARERGPARADDDDVVLVNDRALEKMGRNEETSSRVRGFRSAFRSFRRAVATLEA